MGIVEVRDHAFIVLARGAFYNCAHTVQTKLFKFAGYPDFFYVGQSKNDDAHHCCSSWCRDLNFSALHCLWILMLELPIRKHHRSGSPEKLQQFITTFVRVEGDGNTAGLAKIAQVQKNILF